VSPDLGHAVIASMRTPENRWEVRCRCGRIFLADDKETALSAHLEHFNMARAKTVAEVWVPKARAALRKET